jgi:opacity protein-like surface antigen
VTSKIGAFVIRDAGGGGSSPTWEIVYGAGYKVLKNATAQIGYRRLYFNRQDGNTFGLDATQQGLILGTTIRFRWLS